MAIRSRRKRIETLLAVELSGTLALSTDLGPGDGPLACD